MSQAVEKTKPTELDLAAQEWREAKAAEDAARTRRLTAEAAITQLAGVKTEGTTTVSTSFFKVTTTGKMSRAVDAETLQDIRADVPALILARVFTYKPTLSLSGLRHIEANEPEYYRVIARAITAKPAKPAVKIELIDPPKE